MRIVLVDPGPQVPYYDRALARELAASGDEVTWATAPMLYDSPRAVPRGVKVDHMFAKAFGAPGAKTLGLANRPWLRRAMRGAGYPAELGGLVRRVVRERTDVLHWQWGLMPPLDAFALSTVRRAGAPVVYTVHNVLPHEPRIWHVPLYRQLYPRLGHIIVHSEATRRRLAALAGIAPERIWVVPIAADAPSAPLEPRGQARRRLGLDLSPTAPLALFFGHVRPYKGVDVLLDAWPLVLERLSSAQLLIAGAVAGGGEGEQLLSQMVRSRGLEASVHLHTGYVPGDRVSSYVAAANVVVLPYRHGDDSAVVALARGHGRAVVTTAVGGVGEAVSAGGGLVVPPGDAGALADAVAWVLAVPAERGRLEAEAVAAAREWTWTDVATRTRSVYALARSLAARPGTGTGSGSGTGTGSGVSRRIGGRRKGTPSA